MTKCMVVGINDDQIANLCAPDKSGRPPPLGLHLVMGKDAGVKAGNTAGNIVEGAIAPVLLLAAKS